MRQNRNISIQDRDGDENNLRKKQHISRYKPIKLKNKENSNNSPTIFKKQNNKGFHSLSLERIKDFNTNFELGLTNQQIEQRQRQFGYNISEKNILDYLQIVKLNHTFLYILLGCLHAVLYGKIDKDMKILYFGCIIIVYLIIINSVILIYYIKYQRFVDSTKSQLLKNYKVIRENKSQMIEQKDLVIGDIILIFPGQKIPATIRIIESHMMFVLQANPKGKFKKISKQSRNQRNANYNEDDNILFAGSYCISGQAKGVVVSTGDYTGISQAGVKTRNTCCYLRNYVETQRIVQLLIFVYICCMMLFFAKMTNSNRLPDEEISLTFITLLISNIPLSQFMHHSISKYIAYKKLMQKNILLNNDKILYKMSNFTTILTDKTGILTSKNLNVVYLLYNGRLFNNKNTSTIFHKFEEFNIFNEDFQCLWFSALVCSNAHFDKELIEHEFMNVDYENIQILGGDSSDEGVLRFLQQLEDIEEARKRIIFYKNSNGSEARIPLPNALNVSAVLIEEESLNSHYSIYFKGTPQIIWSYCKYIQIDSKRVEIDLQQKNKYKKQLVYLQRLGVRLIAYGKYQLPKEEYPRGNTLNCQNVNDIQQEWLQLTFCGLLAFMEQPKEQSLETIPFLKSIDIQTIMATQDFSINSTQIARYLNILPKDIPTNEEMYPSRQKYQSEWEYITQYSESVVVDGYQLNNFLFKDDDRKLSRDNINDFISYFAKLLKKPFIIFTRLIDKQKSCIAESLKQDQKIIAGLIGFSITDYEIFNHSDFKISMNSEILKEDSDIIILDNKFSSITEIIEEGRTTKDNLFKVTSHLISSDMVRILSFLSFILLQIPLPLNSFQCLILSLFVDSLSVVSYAFDKHEIDAVTRTNFKQKKSFIFPVGFILYSYFQIGIISFCAGIIGYLTTFNYYGFPVNTIFGLAKEFAYEPPFDDFNIYLNQNKNEYDPFFNQNLYNISFDCTQKIEQTDQLKFDLDYLNKNHTHYDLRKVFIKCNNETKRWVSNMNWSYCDVNSDSNKSPVSNQTICYSTEAIYYAQTSFFVCILFIQITKIFLNNTRIQPFFTGSFNKVKFVSMLLILIVPLILLQIPGIQGICGLRPIHFWNCGIPSFFFCIFLFTIEEIRKYLVTKYRWFYKYFSF